MDTKNKIPYRIASILKERRIGIAALTALLAEYILIRYPLFGLHGMKQWPFVLAAAAFVVSLVAALRKNGIVPAVAAIGYGAGFAAGFLFQTKEPGKTNLWIIWTVTLLCFVVFGSLLSAIRTKRAKRSAPLPR